MSKFDLFASDSDTAESGDVMPSTDFGPRNTGLYKMQIVLAYLVTAKSGAQGVTLHLKNADGTGAEVRQTVYMTTKAVNGVVRTTYVDSNNVKTKLPGMELIDSLHALVTGEEFAKAEDSEKTIKVWNFDKQKEVNTDVTVIDSLMNQPILVGIHKCRDNKNELVDGVWKPTSKERWSNEINKFFDPDTGKTYAEIKSGATEPAWLAQWKEKFPEDYIRDRYKKVDDGIEEDFKNAGTGKDSTKSLFSG